MAKKISIVGTVGLPAKYGGFETLVENLAIQHHVLQSELELTVYCSSRSYPERSPKFKSTLLRYIPLSANGAQSIIYDVLSILSAAWNRADVVLLLGVSGAISLPFLRIISRARIITNIDGIEWRRAKWKGIAKVFLKFSEKISIRFSHLVIADNQAIAEYISDNYRTTPQVIAYGGDHAIKVQERESTTFIAPLLYSFALCRIEPENNVHLILSAFAAMRDQNIVFVGNWSHSAYAKALRQEYALCRNIFFSDPIYDLGVLKNLRKNASSYIHGHSAGGTNPSLVEAMHFSVPVVAFDCDFNRYTTEGKASYFATEGELILKVQEIADSSSSHAGSVMKEIAERRYTWDVVSGEYFDLFERYSRLAVI